MVVVRLGDYTTVIIPAIKSVEGGESGTRHLPTSLLVVLETGAWQEFRDLLGNRVHYERFDQFVRAKNGDGLGTTPDELRRLLEVSRHLNAPKADDAIVAVKVALNEQGRRRDREAEPPSDSNGSGGTGERTDYTLARLKRDHPELYADVAAKALSVNAAAVQAGIRRPKATIYTDDANRAVAVLLKHFTQAEITAALAVNTKGNQ